MARDLFHNIVKTALEKEGWKITHDPYQLRYGIADLYIDLAAEPDIPKASQSGKVRIAENCRLDGKSSRLACVFETGQVLRPIELPLGEILLRNLVFLAIILAHGFRRLVPF